MRDKQRPTTEDRATQPMHYRLRSIEGGQFRLANFASHFIRVQIFQIDFPLILYL